MNTRAPVKPIYASVEDFIASMNVELAPEERSHNETFITSPYLDYQVPPGVFTPNDTARISEFLVDGKLYLITNYIMLLKHGYTLEKISNIDFKYIKSMFYQTYENDPENVLLYQKLQKGFNFLCELYDDHTFPRYWKMYLQLRDLLSEGPIVANHSVNNLIHSILPVLPVIN